MNKEKYVGGAFATDDSKAFRTSESTSYFQDSSLQLTGFETGADALAWLLSKTLIGTENLVYFPLHYCQETIDRVCLKAPQAKVLRYSDVSEIEPKSVVVWNHFNGHDPVPNELLNDDFTVLEDCVQSLKSMKSIRGFAGFTSLRKWLELDLALVLSPFSQDQNFLESDYHGLKKKAEDIKSEWKLNPDSMEESSFLSLFSEAEEVIQNPKIFAKSTMELNHYDWQKLVTHRAKNAEFLLEKLKGLNISIVGKNELFVMISIENRDEIRKILAKHGIFAPIHWLDSADKTLAKTLLSLPIDQRYNTEDLQRVVTAIEHGLAASGL